MYSTFQWARQISEMLFSKVDAALEKESDAEGAITDLVPAKIGLFA